MHRHHHEPESHNHHCHGHDSHFEPTTPLEERLALLAYLLDHNRHHTKEIEDQATAFDNGEAELLRQAVGLYSDANDKIEEFLKNVQQGA